MPSFGPDAKNSILENLSKGLIVGGGLVAGGYGLNEFRKWVIKKLNLTPKIFDDDEEDTGFYLEKKSQQSNTLLGPITWGASTVMGAFGMKKLINFLKEKEEQYIGRGIIDEINRKQKNLYTDSLTKESQDKEISDLLDGYMEKQALLPVLLGNLAGIATLGVGGYMLYNELNKSETGNTMLQTLKGLYNQFPEIYGPVLGALGATTGLGGYYAMNHYLGEKPYYDYLNVPQLEYRSLNEDEKKKFREKLNRPVPMNKKSSKKKVAQQANDWNDVKWVTVNGQQTEATPKQILYNIMNRKKMNPVDLKNVGYSGRVEAIFRGTPPELREQYTNPWWKGFATGVEDEIRALSDIPENEKKEPWQDLEWVTDDNGYKVPATPKQVYKNLLDYQKITSIDLAGLSKKDINEKLFNKLPENFTKKYTTSSFWDTEFDDEVETDLTALGNQLGQTIRDVKKEMGNIGRNFFNSLAEPKNLAGIAGVGAVFNTIPTAVNAFGQYNINSNVKQTNKLLEEQNEMLRKGKPKTLMELSRMEHNG